MLRISAFLLIVALSVCGFAFSESSIMRDIKTAEAQTTTKENQPGTDKNPLTIKILPSHQSKEDTAKKDAYRKEKAVEDSLIAKATIWLAGVTTPLAIFTAFLWWVTLQLSRAAKKSSERQSKEMEKSLDLTEKQMALTGRQTDLAEKQHGLQRWQYLTTHRPKLIIRRISLDEGTPIGIPIGMLWKIQFIIANVGGSHATIIESNATFLKFDDGLPAIPPFSKEVNTVKIPDREAGQSDPPEFLHLDTATINTLCQYQGHGNSKGAFHFFGYIQYQDDLEIVRRMAFCRRYDVITKRFSKVDDPEYEYSD